MSLDAFTTSPEIKHDDDSVEEEELRRMGEGKKSNSGNGTEEMNVQHKPKHKLDFVLLLCRLQSSKRERNEMK